MKVMVNGKEQDIQDGITVDKLLSQLGIKDKTMAAAINMQVIKKDDWEIREIKEGEKVEFLHFVGGG